MTSHYFAFLNVAVAFAVQLRFDIMAVIKDDKGITHIVSIDIDIWTKSLYTDYSPLVMRPNIAISVILCSHPVTGVEVEQVGAESEVKKPYTQPPLLLQSVSLDIKTNTTSY